MNVETEEATSGTDASLTIVGIGPGLPDHLTQRARNAIRTADTVYAASVYQSFLETDGVLDTSDASGPERVVESERERQTELAIESFERVRSGEAVVHVSGGDPNVYGKADILFSIAEAEGYTDIDMTVVPGVTAALGGAAALGAPLGNDFAAISLSDTWADWVEIERKLSGATEAGFVLALYNGWRVLDKAISVVQDHRVATVPAAILVDIGRGDMGRHSAGESVTISTLGSILADWDGTPTPGLLVIIGTGDTRILDTERGRFLVTPRGEYETSDL